MLNFQEQQMKDLDGVFFNAPAMEFVEPREIAGIRGNKASPAVTCNVVIDREKYMEQRVNAKAENVSLNGLLFYIKTAEWIEKFTNIPKIGSAMLFDGDRYQVDNVIEDMGMLEITLESYRG